MDTYQPGNHPNNHRKYVMCRSLMYILATGYNMQLQGWHHRSHQGEPGNGMAYTIANFGAASHCRDDSFWDCLCSRDMVWRAPWMWLLYRRDLMEFWPGPRVVIEKPEQVLQDDRPTFESMVATERKEINFKMITRNPMSLKPEKGKQQIGFSLVETAMRTLREHGGHLIALQGTSLPRKISAANPHFPNPHFRLQHQADERGVGGIILGLTKTIPYATKEDGTHLYFSDDNLRYVDGTEQLLIARLECETRRLSYKGRWSEDLERRISGLPRKFLKIALMDVKGGGSNTSAAIGGLAADNESVNGRYFHNFLKRHEMWRSATFESAHVGRHTTWTSPQGSESRIGFTSLPFVELLSGGEQGIGADQCTVFLA